MSIFDVLVWVFFYVCILRFLASELPDVRLGQRFKGQGLLSALWGGAILLWTGVLTWLTGVLGASLSIKSLFPLTVQRLSQISWWTIFLNLDELYTNFAFSLQETCELCDTSCRHCFGPRPDQCLTCPRDFGLHAVENRCTRCCRAEDNSTNCCVCDSRSGNGWRRNPPSRIVNTFPLPNPHILTFG